MLQLPVRIAGFIYHLLHCAKLVNTAHQHPLAAAAPTVMQLSQRPGLPKARPSGDALLVRLVCRP